MKSKNTTYKKSELVVGLCMKVSIFEGEVTTAFITERTRIFPLGDDIYKIFVPLLEEYYWVKRDFFTN